MGEWAMRDKLLDQMLRHRIVVILRGVKPEEMVEICKTLAEAGARFIEVPLNTPGALECIRLATDHFRDSNVHIGAGTVLKPDAVDAVFEAGGKYIISPNTRPDVIRRTLDHGMLSIPGFATPTEAFTAVDAGADILKCFPCGTPGNIAVLKSVVPLPVFAVGGITCDNRDAYLGVAAGVGVGIGIYRPGMTIEELRQSAARFFDLS
jgi:2-dehydro-3-deoxyphosphogalactonate aldolase